MTQTIDVVAGMMRENTGRSLGDSGGTPRYDENGNYVGSEHGYGRGYERAAGRDFNNEPYQTVEFYVSTYKDKPELETTVSINTAQWLDERYEVAEGEIAELWEQCKNDPEFEETAWLRHAEAFVQDYLPEHGYEPAGIYGEGEPLTINTYNHQSALDSVLQFVYFEIDGTEYVLLQTHNGCDVRGGYGTPVLFTNNGNYSELEILRDSDASVRCEDCDAMWYTDDAYHYYKDGNATRDLADYDVYKVEDEAELAELREQVKAVVEGNPNQLTLIESESGQYEGSVLVHNYDAYCPHCAGKLG
jgi:hypothetical protein